MITKKRSNGHGNHLTVYLQSRL